MPSSTLPRSSGKPICGTPIVERKDAPAVVDHQDRTVAAVNNEPSLRPEFCKAPASASSAVGASMGVVPSARPQVIVIVVFWTGLPPRSSGGFTTQRRIKHAIVRRVRADRVVARYQY